MKFLILTIFISITLNSLHIVHAVRINVDTSQAPDLATFGSRVKRTLEARFDYFANQLRSPGYTPTNSFHIYFDPNYKGVAYAGGGRVVGSVDYYRRNSWDIGSMIHEMIHIIQRYRNGCPSWVTEGIADYYRYFHYEPNRKPSKPNRNQNYRQGYGVTAYFLNYIITRVNSNMIYHLNKDCREGTYRDNIWSRHTGKGVDRLWEDMQVNG